jgi:hypothetical protein
MRFPFTSEVAIHISGVQIASINGEHHAPRLEEESKQR